jgi:hypothetical protein
VSFLLLASCSDSRTEAQGATTVGRNSTSVKSTCFDTEYKFAESKKAQWMQSYEQYYGQGKSPIPEAEACNSDLGSIEDVFPDRHLAKCIAMALDLPVEHQISQYLLDQIVHLNINGLTGASENEITDGELSARSVEDLSGLELLRNIRILTLNLNKVIDVSQLSAMPFLRDVELRGTPVSDLTPLLGLDNLQILYIDKSNENAKGFDELKNKGVRIYN